jgi:adenylosuccinate lyase
VLRANVVPGLEDIALWHERDISHSSVERVVLPDSLQLAYYLAVRFRSIVEGMVVDAERMRANLDASHGLVFSQGVLLALVESGMTRDAAYRAVQRSAMRSWDEGRAFAELLRADPEVASALGSDRLDACFDLTRTLEHAGRAVDALGA